MFMIIILFINTVCMYSFIILSKPISMGTKISNGLPSELKNVKNYSIFKNKLKN
jgi:hypothetical protein